MIANLIAFIALIISSLALYYSNFNIDPVATIQVTDLSVDSYSNPKWHPDVIGHLIVSNQGSFPIAILRVFWIGLLGSTSSCQNFESVSVSDFWDLSFGGDKFSAYRFNLDPKTVGSHSIEIFELHIKETLLKDDPPPSYSASSAFGNCVGIVSSNFDGKLVIRSFPVSYLNDDAKGGGDYKKESPVERQELFNCTACGSRRSPNSSKVQDIPRS